MNATQKAALLAVYQTDTTLQVLLGGVSNATKCSYSLIPPEFPSVNLWEESDNGDPRAGYDQNGVCDHDVTVAIHIYAFDEGKKIGAVYYDVNSLMSAITDRVRILSLNLDKTTGTGQFATTVDSLINLTFRSTNLPFEETGAGQQGVHVQHTSCLLRFSYAGIDSL